MLLFAAGAVQAAGQPGNQPASQAASAARLMVQSGRLGNNGQPGSAEKIALAPGSQLLASADRESIRVWHTATGRLLCELRLDRVNSSCSTSPPDRGSARAGPAVASR